MLSGGLVRFPVTNGVQVQCLLKDFLAEILGLLQGI